MADATAAGSARSLGPDHGVIYLAPFSVLMAVVAITSIARIHTRLNHRGWLDWDDYTLLFAFTVTTAWYFLMVVLYHFGRAVENYVRDPSVVGPIEVSMGVLYSWALNLIRISMCAMLLRLKSERFWRLPLGSLIFIQISLVVSSTCVFLAYCRPISAAWDPLVPNAKCISSEGMLLWAYTYNAFNIFSDFVISLMPLTFIYHMHRSRKEKVLLACLMATGLLATADTVLVLDIVITPLPPPGQPPPIPPWAQSVRFDVLMSLQLFLGIVAANAPCLKGPAHSLLIRLGLLSPRGRDGESATSGPEPGGDGPAAGGGRRGWERMARGRGPVVRGSPESFLDRMRHGKHFAQQLHDMALEDWKKFPGQGVAAPGEGEHGEKPVETSASRTCTGTTDSTTTVAAERELNVMARAKSPGAEWSLNTSSRGGSSSNGGGGGSREATRVEAGFR